MFTLGYWYSYLSKGCEYFFHQCTHSIFYLWVLFVQVSRFLPPIWYSGGEWILMFAAQSSEYIWTLNMSRKNIPVTVDKPQIWLWTVFIGTMTNCTHLLYLWHQVMKSVMYLMLELHLLDTTVKTHSRGAEDLNRNQPSTERWWLWSHRGGQNNRNTLNIMKANNLQQIAASVRLF